MIRIDKTNPPADALGAAARCQQVTEDLKGVYRLLLKFQQQRQHAFPAKVEPRGKETKLGIGSPRCRPRANQCSVSAERIRRE